MNRPQDAPQTHPSLKTLVAIAVIGTITATGVLTYQHTKTSAATGQQTYTSTVGGFSFTYPVGWTAAEGPAGADDEIILAPPSAATSLSSQFIMTLLVAHNPDASDPPAAMPNGTTAKLANGISLWVSTSASALRTAASAGRMVCPELEITNADQSHFSYPLPNGKNLALMAGYCQGQASTTALNYQQQLAQGDWQAAVSIIKSIQFN
jgi:hypothetical protein